MLKYVSIKGGGKPTDFETAILDGFAADGGLYVPEQLPKVSLEQLNQWKDLKYVDLALEILSLFIDKSIISKSELHELLKNAYAPFEKEEVIPLYPMQSRQNTYVMELFYGPTLSFKDFGMAFLVNMVNFFLERKKQHLTLVVATTGDTGPAAAYFAAGKSNLDAWVLYPTELITQEQVRQMTTLPHPNIHPVGVANCPEGGDDLDAVIRQLYANKALKEKLNLSSVNSINWGRVMMQTVHYFYGYLQIVDSIGESVNMSVPSGGFGNLCAGGLAREMGLPIDTLIAANNQNACLDRIYTQGVFSKENIYATPSSAIDILIPINFWRFLYFSIGKDGDKINKWMEEFNQNGIVQFDQDTFNTYRKGFLSNSATDAETLELIKEIYTEENYLLDPHGAVSVVAADALKNKLGSNKLICFATAHPSKFPKSILKALKTKELPKEAKHNSIEAAKNYCEKLYLCDYANQEQALAHAMESYWDVKNK